MAYVKSQESSTLTHGIMLWFVHGIDYSLSPFAWDSQGPQQIKMTKIR